MHPLKRRKIDQADSNLTKPFRSPLRTDSLRTPSRSGAEGIESRITRITTAEFRDPLRSTFDSDARTQITPHDASSPATGKGAGAITTTDHATLQKEYLALSRQLTSLRQSLDTAQQALKIETSKQDTHVQALITKWTSVTREIAEDLFESSKDTFKHQSVETAWLDSGTLPFWEQEEFHEFSDEHRRILEIQNEQVRAQAERYGLLEIVESEPEPVNVSTVP